MENDDSRKSAHLSLFQDAPSTEPLVWLKNLDHQRLIEKENKKANVNARTAMEAMQKLSINPETVLIVKNNELVLAEESLNEGDEIKFLSVISGG